MNGTYEELVVGDMAGKKESKQNKVEYTSKAVVSINDYKCIKVIFKIHLLLFNMVHCR